MQHTQNTDNIKYFNYKLINFYLGGIFKYQQILFSGLTFKTKVILIVTQAQKKKKKKSKKQHKTEFDGILINRHFTKVHLLFSLELKNSIQQ